MQRQDPILTVQDHIWLKSTFYRYVSNAYDKPRFTYHFRAEAPLDIRALLYVPEQRPGLFETSRDGEKGFFLYHYRTSSI